MQHTVGKVTFSGALAETAANITKEEWAYYDFVDNVSDQIAVFMEANDISKAGLAQKMGTSRAFVTKVLAGDANMTFKTFTKVLSHLEAKAEVKIVPITQEIAWFGLVVSNAPAQEVSVSGAVVHQLETPKAA